MKKLLGSVLIVLLLISIVAFTSEKPVPMHSLEGTWELQSFYSFDDGNNISDTIPTTEGYRQIKMYNNGKYMWTRYVPKDSVEWFGYGSYSITVDSLVENMEYGSESMMNAAGALRQFKFELLLGDDHFTQISVDEEGNRTFSENYKRLD